MESNALLTRTETLGASRFVFATELGSGADGASLLERSVCTSRCRVERVAGGGGQRRLIAAQRIAGGHVVLVEEPYAAVLRSAHVQQRCDRTFEPSASGDALKVCPQSRVTRYSSRAAQRAAQREGYGGPEAVALRRCATSAMPPASVRLAARILWRANAEGSGAAARGPSLPPAVALLHHHACTDVAAAAAIASAAHAVLALYASGFGAAEAALRAAATDDASAARRGAELRLAVRLLARLASNAHTVTEARETDTSIGLALYLTAAMVNHACAPNSVQLFRGRSIVLRAVRPIEAGEEITIAYCDLVSSPLQVRVCGRAALTARSQCCRRSAKPPVPDDPSPPLALNPLHSLYTQTHSLYLSIDRSIGTHAVLCSGAVRSSAAMPSTPRRASAHSAARSPSRRAAGRTTSGPAVLLM